MTELSNSDGVPQKWGPTDLGHAPHREGQEAIMSEQQHHSETARGRGVWFGRSGRSSAEIPTASMADIAFLLIIYFMVTTVFSATKGLDLPLPDEEPTEVPPTGEPSIYVQVLPDGSLKVDGQSMALGDLLSYVVPKLRINQAKPVILHPSPSAPYQGMIAVYDELVASGEKTGFQITSIVVPTQREIQEYIDLLGMDPFGTPGG